MHIEDQGDGLYIILTIFIKRIGEAVFQSKWSRCRLLFPESHRKD